MVINCAQLCKPHSVSIEDAASGQSLIQALKSETRLPIIPVKPLGDKIARANSVSPLIESGRVLLPAVTGWLPDFLEELSAFPSAPHDAQVDSLSMALSYLSRHSWTAQDSKELQDTAAMMADYERQQRLIKNNVPGQMIMNVNDQLAIEVASGRRTASATRSARQA